MTPHLPARRHPASKWVLITIGRVLLALAVLASPSYAQESLDDVFGGLGTAISVDEGESEELPADLGEGQGVVSGLVIDAETGTPIANATVIVLWSAAGEGSAPRQEIAVTDRTGSFEIGSIAAGTYDLSFVKSGYRASTMKGFVVEAGKRNRADFPMPPVKAATTADVLQLDAFVVEASAVGDMLDSIEIRMDSNVQLNIMSAADFSKYAASDVADALRRVAGVNIIEGQFAVIRGLEDRYSSTLYNGAPIPSPDPETQSVQLDLFPSEVLSNLLVAKTFSPEHPSNSSGGSIDIVTLEYPDEFTFAVKGAAEVNTNALDRFVLFQPGSPMGRELHGTDVVAGEFGVLIGGRHEIAERDLRYKALFNWESDYRTAQGHQANWQPAIASVRRGQVIRPGDLASGQLTLTDGLFETITSGFSEQGTGYVALGIDLDEEGDHTLDASVFYTRKRGQIVDLKENGYLPDFDYGPVVQAELDEEGIDYTNFGERATLSSWIAGVRAVREFREESPSRGPPWFSNFNDSRSFERARDLLVTQLNGESDFDVVQGLTMHYAANYAQTGQDEVVRGARYFFEPDDVNNIPSQFPVRASDLGPGQYAVNDSILLSENEVDEWQGFGRLDFEYEHQFNETAVLGVKTGGWFEHASRDVASRFLESPTVEGTSQFAILGDTPGELGYSMFSELDRTAEGAISGLRETTNESERQIGAWAVSGELNLWDSFDLFAGLRLESISIKSINQPYTGEQIFDAPSTYPTIYLFFDRLDNPNRAEVLSAPPPGTTFNDQLLGIDMPVNPQTGFVDLLDMSEIDGFVNGRIDELKFLPSLGVTYRPIGGMALRASFSQTVARPSFRELGFYVSVQPGTDDLVVGNPQLKLSDVRSIDGRTEYTWGPLGDLVALSGFYKQIDDPIEGIVIRNPLNAEQSSSALWQTFYNNPNQASLWGLEAEARKYLDFFGSEFMEAFSVGGNFTYIKAEVARTAIEIERVDPFFTVADGVDPLYSGLAPTRRLFGQPEWIANADLTFDQEDWGTRITLAFFAISDVLDSAGSVFLRPNGDTLSYIPDRYIGSYHTLDLVASQTLRVDLVRGDVTLKASFKNLTDSTRKLVYDPSQTAVEVRERSFKLGQTFKFELKYEF